MLAEVQTAEYGDGRDGNDPSGTPCRRCIVSGESRETAALVRFAVGPDDHIVPDIAGSLPGRGIWISADRASIAAAVANRLFARAARRNVIVDEELPARVEILLRDRCLDLIGLARRAGGAVAGFDKVTGFLARNSAGVVFAASDAAAGGRQKMQRGAAGVPLVEQLDRLELGRAFGRDQVVHAVVASGKIADSLLVDARRLSGFRQQDAERGTE